MTKKFILAMFALSAVTFGSFAANDKAPECRKGRECNQKVRCEQKQCDRKARPCPNPFEGLNLTESQNTQLEALRASQPCGKDSAGCKRGERKDKGQRPDCRQGKRDCLAKVKGILTPEQYVTFLENSFVNRGGRKADIHKDGNRCRKHQAMHNGNCNKGNRDKCDRNKAMKD